MVKLAELRKIRDDLQEINNHPFWDEISELNKKIDFFNIYLDKSIEETSRYLQ